MKKDKHQDETAYLLRHPANAQHLMASIAQLQAGKHQPRGAFTVAELLQVDPEEITGSFASHSPNKLTIETLKKSNRGDDLHRADDEESLFKQLGI